MTEEEKNSGNEENQNLDGEKPDNKKSQEKITFTPEQQAEIDRITGGIRTDEKKKYTNQVTTQKSTWEAEKTEYTTKIDSLEKVVSELLVSQMEGLDETTRKLLAKLPTLDQVEFLNENFKDQKKQSAKIPLTPKPSGTKDGFVPKKSNFKL